MSCKCNSHIKCQCCEVNEPGFYIPPTETRKLIAIPEEEHKRIVSLEAERNRYREALERITSVQIDDKGRVLNDAEALDQVDWIAKEALQEVRRE